jgi:hypothetical protein
VHLWQCGPPAAPQRRRPTLKLSAPAAIVAAAPPKFDPPNFSPNIFTNFNIFPPNLNLQFIPNLLIFIILKS